MKTILSYIVSTMVAGFMLITQGQEVDYSLLSSSFDFSKLRPTEDQYYILKTNIKTIEPDGSISNRDYFSMYLHYNAETENPEADGKYTCTKFDVSLGSSDTVLIPAMQNWSYEFIPDPNAESAKDLVFGIDHGVFDGLKDANDKLLPPDKAYMVYNCFIDFHAFCNVFSQPTYGGDGIEELRNIGDEIIHAASNTQPPVNLGTNTKEGSYFKNGIVTLLLKGISSINEKLCAIVFFDSGESSFNMLMEPMPGMEVNTKGGSHYFGDIYINAENNWVEKVVMHEFVNSSTLVPQLQTPITSVIERESVIMNVSKEEFYR